MKSLIPHSYSSFAHLRWPKANVIANLRLFLRLLPIWNKVFQFISWKNRFFCFTFSFLSMNRPQNEVLTDQIQRKRKKFVSQIKGINHERKTVFFFVWQEMEVKSFRGGNWLKAPRSVKQSGFSRSCRIFSSFSKAGYFSFIWQFSGQQCNSAWNTIEFSAINTKLSIMAMSVSKVLTAAKKLPSMVPT